MRPTFPAAVGSSPKLTLWWVFIATPCGLPNLFFHIHFGPDRFDLACSLFIRREKKRKKKILFIFQSACQYPVEHVDREYTYVSFSTMNILYSPRKACKKRIREKMKKMMRIWNYLSKNITSYCTCVRICWCFTKLSNSFFILRENFHHFKIFSHFHPTEKNFFQMYESTALDSIACRIADRKLLCEKWKKKRKVLRNPS